MLDFKFSAEQLDPNKRAAAEQGGAAEVGALLFQLTEGGRLDYITKAHEHGTRWLPEVNHSVVTTFANTWACICCRCPRLGCSRSVPFRGCSLYRISYTRAQWLYAFNFVCFGAHATMYYLCITACNGNRFGTKVNENCTATDMEVSIWRLSSNWSDSSADGYIIGAAENGKPVRFDWLAAWFHGISASFHAFVLLIGPFDRFAFLYWKQLDNAFAWWRWTEYLASAPLMVKIAFGSTHLPMCRVPTHLGWPCERPSGRSCGTAEASACPVRSSSACSCSPAFASKTR